MDDTEHAARKRYRMCGSKKRYDKRGAQTIVNYRGGHKSNGKRTQRPNRELRAYQCPYCNWWHLTDNE